MTVYENLEQGTPEWLAARRGKPTASQFKRIVGVNGDLTKTGPETYINELIAQAFVPSYNPGPPDTYWIKRGKEFEGEARIKFGIHAGVVTHEVGFVLHSGGVLGCSPDFLIKDEHDQWSSGGEIKCGAPNTHVEWIRAGILPPEHRAQIHGSMVCSEVSSWHFWAYFPGLQPLHILVEWDDYTERLQKSLLEFADKYRDAYQEAVPKLTLPAELTEVKPQIQEERE